MTVQARFCAAAALLLVAGACSQEAAEPANQQQTAEADQMTADPANPYADAEMQMGQRMMAAVGQNAADSWVRKMIEHHRGAIEMTDILGRSGGEPQVVEKARETAEAQRRELQELERMLRGGVSGNPPPNPFAEGERRSHQRMMTAVGANPSETWLRKMIEHHRGGIEMSEMVIAQGGNAEVSAMARRTADEQRRDIGELERLLGGGPPQKTAAASPPPSAPAVEKAKAEPAPKAKAAPKEEPKAAEPKAPASEETCTPEHRAAGHC